MDIQHCTYEEFKNSLPSTQPFVGQMIAVKRSEVTTVLYVVSRITEGASVVWVTYNDLSGGQPNDGHRVFSREQWDALAGAKWTPPPFFSKKLPTPSGEDVSVGLVNLDASVITRQVNHKLLKSLDEWDNPLQRVEDKGEGDAMMEFFKGGKS